MAKREGKDPSSFMPTPIYGFGGLKKRVETQEETRKANNKHLKALGNEITKIQVCVKMHLCEIANVKMEIKATFLFVESSKIKRQNKCFYVNH